MPDEIEVDSKITRIAVIGCARCGESHDVNFTKFTLSNIDINGDIFTHWGICPNINEPILLKIVEH